MLPTLYAAINGELPARDLEIGAAAPTVETLGEWPDARRWATVFWQAVVGDSRITAPFRAIARKNARFTGAAPAG